jgi:hypothetical protein
MRARPVAKLSMRVCLLPCSSSGTACPATANARACLLAGPVCPFAGGVLPAVSNAGACTDRTKPSSAALRLNTPPNTPPRSTHRARGLPALHPAAPAAMPPPPAPRVTRARAFLKITPLTCLIYCFASLLWAADVRAPASATPPSYYCLPPPPRKRPSHMAGRNVLAAGQAPAQPAGPASHAVTSGLQLPGGRPAAPAAVQIDSPAQNLPPRPPLSSSPSPAAAPLLLPLPLPLRQRRCPWAGPPSRHQSGPSMAFE